MTRQFLEDLLDVQFFGEFLIDRWIIKREQLLEALEYQMSRNERFGAIAVKKGYLTKAQVAEINQRQRQSDMTFGEVAVNGGMLSAEQVKEIVQFQRDNNLFLGQALLHLNYIDEDVLRRELANFREHQKRFSSQTINLPITDTAAQIIVAGVDTTKKMFRRVPGIVIKTGRAVIMTPDGESTPRGYFATVTVAFSGDDSVRFFLSVTKSVATPIATNILGTDAACEPEETIGDAVREFCNYICGNTVAKVGRKGIKVDIVPPERLAEIPEPPAGWQTVAFPVRATAGGIDLRFHTRRVERSQDSARPT